jgi:hypothetical protein
MNLALNDELLVAIAQIAIAIIGFSGVVVSLGRSKHEWSQSELLQLRTLVEPSAASLAGTSLPFLVSLVEVHGDIMWRVCNGGLLILLGIAHMLFMVRGAKNENAVVISQTVIGVFCGVIYLVMLLSILDIFQYHQFAFLLGLLVGIGVSVHNFYLLLFRNEGVT